MTVQGNEEQETRSDARIFARSIPHQVRMQEIVKALGDIEGLSCLEIGSDNAMMSHQLHRRGGDWETVVYDDEEAARMGRILGRDVRTFSADQPLPFDAKSFDIVVIVDGLERQESDIDFVQKCHAVMKPDSRMIACVNREKTVSPLNPLRRMLGVVQERQGHVYTGYTEGHLFQALKHGFDVMQMRSFSRFFVELVHVFIRVAEKKAIEAGGPAKPMRAYAIGHVFYWLAYQVDLLMFFTRGHRLIASAKRRHWRSRNTPILVDGRSISEAVLSAPL